MSINVNDLSSAVLLLESDFRYIRSKLKDIDLINFNKQLNECCSRVFDDCLISNKNSIDSSEMKERLEVIKKNLESCKKVGQIQGGESRLDFVGERISEVNVLVGEKLSQLGEKVCKFDRNLSFLSNLIDSHIEFREINKQLSEMLASDTEPAQFSGDVVLLEARFNELTNDKSLKKHFDMHHKTDNEGFLKGISEMKLRAQSELLLKGIVFILEGLKAGTSETSAFEQVFAQFPPKLQWAVFKNAGIVAEEFPLNLEIVQPKFMAHHSLKPMQGALDRRNAQVGGILFRHACNLFLDPEKAFVACVMALEGYEDALIGQSVAEGLRTKYLSDAQAIEKKRIDSSLTDPFEGLKGIIGLNSKSEMDESSRRERIQQLLLDAEKRGLRLHGPKGVYFWVWFLAHQKDPSVGGLTFGQDNAHKNSDRLIQAIDEATSTPSQLLQRYESIEIRSMRALKTELEKVKAHSLNSETQQDIVHAILLAALNGGVVLNEPRGVYYHVWAIANKMDKRARGDNWGRDNASKNIDRLLQAIDLSQKVSTM